MKTFAYTKTNDLAQLMDEIVAAIPALTGSDAAAQPNLRVEGLGTAIRVTVPDAQAQAPIDAVVAAHTPATRPPLPRAAVLAAIQSAATVADVKAALVAYFQKSGGP